MKMFVPALAATVFTVALGAAGVAGAADDASLAAPQGAAAGPAGTAEDTAATSFGTGSQDFWISAPQFAARTGGAQWSYQSFLYFATPVSAQYEAQVELPAGGVVTVVECFFRDTTANDASVGFWRQSYNYVTDTPSVTNITTVSSTGTAGYQKPFQNVSEQIRYRNGDLRTVYTLIANMPGDLNVSFRGCRLFWNRSISPAPAAATFTDVPVGHAQFRFVEALNAAAITGGCGGGNFCPDAPLTRGQMAVFLSAALGLHFPY